MGDALRRRAVQVALAFLAVYVIWGSTYFAILIVLETLPPFLTAGVRFLTAGAVLYGLMRLRGTPAPERRHWPTAFVIGALLLLCGNGAVMWAEQRVPSGIAALLVAVEPLWIVLLSWLRPGGERPRLATALGVGLGFGGLVLLIGPDQLSTGGAVDLMGALAIVFGAFTWAAGSLYSLSAKAPASPFMTTAMNMLAGGALLILAGVLAGEPARLDLAAVSGRSLGALAYLTVFGSLVAFTAYIWLINNVSPARVSTYAYVNPVVAVLLGWAAAGEELSWRVGVAAATIVGAVALITTASSRKAAPAPAPAVERPRGPELSLSGDPCPAEA